MFRSPRSRNGRNKRSKIKPVIQISMLIGVSIWLLYQIHHSDDKKSSVTTKISQALNNDGSTNISKLGRKVLRPKVKATEDLNQADDEQKDGKEGSEEAGEDHESEEHEEVAENEHTDDKEDKEDNEEINETKQGEEIEERVNGNKSNKQENQVVVLEDMEKKKSADMKDVEMSDASEDDNDNDNDDVDQSVRGEAENDKMMDNGEDDSEENDTSGGQRPSVDHYENDTKKQTAQLVNNAPDSYSYETNAANYMKSTTNDENTKADGESEEKDENTKADSESEEKDDVSLLEEKEALTDLETLPESRTGGSINLDNAATE